MMKKTFSKKNLIIFSSTLLLSLVIFIFAKPVHAGVGDVVAEIIGWIILALVSFVGQLLSLVIWVLIMIAQYSGFGTAAPVVYGWAIVRDVCNMFFILILLIIAFATILRIESYSFKKLLPKLIMMAVLINFSRLICNIFIDFTQVIMLTFVNGFKEVGGGNLTEMLGITDLLNVKSDPDVEVSFWSILGTYLLALVYAVVALVVVFTMVAVLAMRMVMLWIYIVLSPAAYLLSAFPQGQSYASRWWSDFTKNLLVGPILAFFIWLSFASLGGTSTGDGKNPVDQVMENNGAGKPAALGSAATSGPSVGISTAGSPDNMIKLIISIGMLIGGLQIAQEMGGAGGKMAGKGMSALQGLGSGVSSRVSGAGKKIYDYGKDRAKEMAGVVGGGLKVAGGTMDRFAGTGLDRLVSKLGGKKPAAGEEGTFGGKGAFTTSLQAVRNAPGNIKEQVSARFSRNKAIDQFRREGGAETRFQGKNYKKDETGFYETNEAGNAVNQMNWKNIDDKKVGDYKVNFGEKQYQYDKKADSYYEVDKDTGKNKQRRNEETGAMENIALQHNGKELKSNEFASFAENVEGASVSSKGADGKETKYKFDKTAGDFRSIDATGKFEVGATAKALSSDKDAAVEKSYLRYKDKEGKAGNKVGAMSALGKSWHDAYKTSFSAAAATRNKAEDEKVSKEQQTIASSGASSGDMLRDLNNVSTSSEKKKALAMTLAVKDGFKTKKDVDTARAALGGNKILQDKFNDTVDKNQAHLAYDFSSTAGRDAFKSHIDSGAIDDTKLDNVAYEDPAILSTIKEYRGKDYGRVIETASKRDAKHEKSVAVGQLASRAFDENGELVKGDAAAKTHAKITGEVFSSFTNNDANKTLNVSSMTEYLKSAKTEDLNKIDFKKFQQGLDGCAPEIKKMIASAMNYSQIKNMSKSGNNPDMTRAMAKLVSEHGSPSEQERVRSDKDLVSLADLKQVPLTNSDTLSNVGKKPKKKNSDTENTENKEA